MLLTLDSKYKGGILDILTLNNKDKWITSKYGFKMRVEYPNQDQMKKLAILKGAITKYQNLDKYDFSDKNTKIDPQDVIIDDAAQLEYTWYLFKYTVKEFKGLFSGGEDAQANIVNNELCDEQWEALIRVNDFIPDYIKKYEERMRWDEVDKKKSTSMPNSSQTEVLEDSGETSL